MTKAHSPINWQNSPSVNTPINETNLNKMDSTIGVLDDRIVALDTTKASQTDMLTAITGIDFDEDTGKFTFTRKNGSSVVIDTKLEKLVLNWRFDNQTQTLYLVLEDGTEMPIDLSSFITSYEFEESSTIRPVITSDGVVSFEVIDGSITEEKLRPNFLAEIKVESESAKSSATSASLSATNAENSAVRAEKAAEEAESIVGGDFATNAKVDNIINGTTPVGEAESVNGVKIFKDISQLGITSYYIPDIVKAMPTYSMFFCKSNSSQDDLNKAGNDLPKTTGNLEIVKLTGGRTRVLYASGDSAKKDKVYYCDLDESNWKINGWKYIGDGGNADTVDGKHASDFFPANGGTVKGDITIQKADNGQAKIVKNHSATADYGTILKDVSADGTYSQIVLRSNNNTLKYEVNDGSTTTKHDVLHTGNMDLIKSIQTSGLLSGDTAIDNFYEEGKLKIATFNSATGTKFSYGGLMSVMLHDDTTENSAGFQLAFGEGSHNLKCRINDSGWREWTEVHTDAYSARVLIRNTPLTSSDGGNQGAVRFDSNGIYIYKNGAEEQIYSRD